MFYVLPLLSLIVLSTTTATAQSQQTFHDAAGRLSAVIDTANGVAQYSYDATGNILSIVRNPATTLVVVQFAPSSGPTRTKINIYGTGFGTTANTTVKFNGVSATPTAVSANLIAVAVPSTATSGFITVTSPAGTVTTSSPYTVGGPIGPSITGISPAGVAPGGSVTISGANFDAALSKVYINNQPAYVTGATAIALTATVPIASSGHATVETPVGSAVSATDLLVPPAPYAASAIGSSGRWTLGQTASATVASPGSIGLVLFDATIAQRVSFVVSTSSISSGSLCLYAPNGGQVGACSGLGAGTFFGAQILPLTGTYSLAVLPGAGATGSTTMALYNVPPDPGGPIAYGGTVTAVITTPGQNAVATFTGAAGDRISLATTSTQPHCDTIQITDPNSVTKLYSNFNCSNGDFSGVLVLPTAGTYTIQFLSGGGDTGTVVFKLYNVPPDAGGPITYGGTVTAVITTPGQHAFATFSGAAGDRISLATTSTQPNCDTIRITDPDGVTKLYNNFNCSTGDFSNVLILPTAGTYTIQFLGGGADTGTVVFKLYNVPPDAGGPIAYGGTVTAVITTPGQNAFATFTGAAGGRISLATTSTQSHCDTIQITDPDGVTKLYSNFNCSTGDFSHALVLPTVGTYTIQFLGGGADTGTVVFKLYSVPPDASGSTTIDGATVPLTTTVPGQNMQLTFPGASNQTAKISVVANASFSSVCFSVKTSNPDGSVLRSDLVCGTGYASPVLTLPQGGNYNVLIYSSSDAVGNATIGVTAQ